MINNVLFIALVVLAVTEVIFAVGFFTLMNKVKELKVDYEFFKSITITYRNCMEEVTASVKEVTETVHEEAEVYEHMYTLLDNFCDQMTSMQTIHSDIYKQYQNILKQYGIFHESYQRINENYKRLLNCWKDVTSASDNASEQFRLCALELKRYADILAPWVIDSDQLGQEYVDANQKAPHTARYLWDNERGCKTCKYGVYNEDGRVWFCNNSPNLIPYSFPCDSYKPAKTE